MELGNERGIKTGKWLTNELLQSSDINAVGELTYLNTTDLLALLAEQGKATGSTKDTVIAGLLLEWSTVLTSNLRAGACVSFSGYYLDSLGVWGFNVSAGEIFSVVLPKDVAVVVESGSASDRYDTIEIRPVQTGYDTESRKFKDPITGLVTSRNTATKIEYTCEVQVLKGTSGGGSAPTHTSGWIKVAEVFVAASASVIDQDDIKDVRDSKSWTTEVNNTKYKVDDTLIRTDVTQAITLSSPKKYLVSGNYELTLPTSPAKGETIDILSDGYFKIKQGDSEQVIDYKNKHFTTKGTSGYIQMFERERLELMYKGTGLSRIEPGVKLTDPSNLPAGQGNACAFSYSGVYFVVGHSGTPYITIYKRSGDTFTKLVNPASLPASNVYDCAFSYDGTYLAVCEYNSPYLVIYKRTAGTDTFVRLSTVGTTPTGHAMACAFSYDGTYLAVRHYTTPFITIYKRSGDVFTKLSDPASLPSAYAMGCTFSYDGNYLAVVDTIAPYLIIYRRSGDVFTKLTDPTVLPPSAGSSCAFSFDGTYLAVAHGVTPFVTIYKRNGDVFDKLPDPPSLPTSHGSDCAFSYDGNYLLIALSFIPGTTYLAVYKRNGDTFIKITDPAVLPPDVANSCAFSFDGVYSAIAHNATPFITIYKNREAATKVWLATNFETMNPTDPSDGDGGDLEYRFK